ncbi:MAG: DUF4105 domain-containing protein [Gemmatimonadaceae bacterium]|jgi:hypothetical protein
MALLLVVAPVAAQAPDPAPLPPGASAALDSARATRGEALTVSLYTYGPSDVFFERFGHAAIGISDRLTQQDVAFNWGIFDFDQPNFLLRFLTGDTKYQMAGYPTLLFNGVYQADNRSIRQQVLALTPVERAALLEYVQWNAREANKFYRYDYYRDNCSTRVRDLLNWVLRGQLQPALQRPGSGRTWRGETARVLHGMTTLVLGIDIALGRHADAPLSAWDEEFLPEHMAEHLAAPWMRVNGVNGARALVAHDTVLFASTRPPLPAQAPSRVLWALVAGLVLSALLLIAGQSPTVAPRRIAAVAVALWGLVTGLLGVALLVFATVTKHAPYMGANTTLLLAQPLMLVVAVLLPRALWRGVSTPAARGLSALIAGCALVAVVAEVLPAFHQESLAVLALIVPVQITLALLLWRLPRTAATGAQPAGATASAHRPRA